jgi:hypothetical protein
MVQGNSGGVNLEDEEWTTSFVRTLEVMLSGDTIDVRDFYSRSIQDDTYLMPLNAHHEPVSFVLSVRKKCAGRSFLILASRKGFWKIRQSLLPLTNTKSAIALSLCCV